MSILLKKYIIGKNYAVTLSKHLIFMYIYIMKMRKVHKKTNIFLTTKTYYEKLYNYVDLHFFMYLI